MDKKILRAPQQGTSSPVNVAFLCGQSGAGGSVKIYRVKNDTHDTSLRSITLPVTPSFVVIMVGNFYNGKTVNGINSTFSSFGGRVYSYSESSDPRNNYIAYLEQGGKTWLYSNNDSLTLTGNTLTFNSDWVGSYNFTIIAFTDDITEV